MDDFGWMHDIKPTLGQMWDEGLISKGDILVLEGHVANDSGDTTKYFDDFKIKIATKLRSIRDSKFIPLTKEGSEWVGYNNTPVWFFHTDGNLLVLDYIKTDESLNESDDFEWIRDSGLFKIKYVDDLRKGDRVSVTFNSDTHYAPDGKTDSKTWLFDVIRIDYNDFVGEIVNSDGNVGWPCNDNLYGNNPNPNLSNGTCWHVNPKEADVFLVNRVGYFMENKINESQDGLDWIKNELSNKGPLDGIRFRVRKSIAPRSINVIEDKDGDSEWVSVFWQTDDKGDIRSERYSREMVERYLSDGWWKRLN